MHTHTHASNKMSNLKIRKELHVMLIQIVRRSSLFLSLFHKPSCSEWFPTVFLVPCWLFLHHKTRARMNMRLCSQLPGLEASLHDDVIKWKHFPRHWPFVRGIHRSSVNSTHKGQWRGALMFTLIWARINGWVNNREAGDLRRHRVHYDVTVMEYKDNEILIYCFVLKGKE